MEDEIARIKTVHREELKREKEKVEMRVKEEVRGEVRREVEGEVEMEYRIRVEKIREESVKDIDRIKEKVKENTIAAIKKVEPKR
jgi:hypothetical protein